MRPVSMRSGPKSIRGCLLTTIAILASLTGISQANTRISDLTENPVSAINSSQFQFARLIIEDASPVRTKTPAGFYDVSARVGYVVPNQGSAELSNRIRTFDRREALQVARTLARAKIARIAPGNANSRLRDKQEITTLNDAALYLETLSQGFPYQEIWQTSEKNGEFTVRLRARLRTISLPQQRIKAAIAPGILSSNQSLTISLQGLLDSAVAIYAWQADNTVVRLYPASPNRPMGVRAGKKYQLPRPDDHIQVLRVRPMPNSMGNHEAIIILASGIAKGISTLAPGLRASLAGSRLPTTGEFLNRLSKLEAGTYQLSFQSYQVLAAQ